MNNTPISSTAQNYLNVEGKRTWTSQNPNQFASNNAFNSVDILLESDGDTTHAGHQTIINDAKIGSTGIMQLKDVKYDMKCVSGSSNWYKTVNSSTRIAAWAQEKASDITGSSIVLDCSNNSCTEGSSSVDYGIYISSAMNDASMNTSIGYDNFKITLTPTNVYAYAGTTGITGTNMTNGLNGLTGITDTNANNVWTVINPNSYVHETTVGIGGSSGTGSTGNMIFGNTGQYTENGLTGNYTTGLNAIVYGIGSQSQFPLDFALRITPKSPDNLVRNVTNSSSYGFLKNTEIRLHFPEDAIKIKQKAIEWKMETQVDKFETTLNRAAEEATKEALSIFMNSITNMSVQDGFAILNGGNGAATKFLKDQTTQQLIAAFRPKVEAAISTVKLTDYWKENGVDATAAVSLSNRTTSFCVNVL